MPRDALTRVVFLAALALPAATGARAGPCFKSKVVWQESCNSVSGQGAQGFFQLAGRSDDDQCVNCGTCFGVRDKAAVRSLKGSDENGTLAECGGCWELGVSPQITCAGGSLQTSCESACNKCFKCFGVDESMLPSLDAMRLEQQIETFEAEMQACEPTDAIGVEYGDMSLGCCGYADILAMYTASSARWAEVSSWVPRGGVEQGTITADMCRNFCASFGNNDCSVWTLRDGDCWLKRALHCSNEVCKVDADSTAVSGARACGVAWRSFRPPSLARALPSVACTASNYIYGVTLAGSCGSASVIQVHGPQGALMAGLKAGWWVAGDAYLWRGADSLSPEELNDKCLQRCTIADGCYAVNSFGAGVLKGLCMLVRRVDCTPAYAKWNGTLVATKDGCADPTSKTVSRALPIPCDAPRCTLPHTDGIFKDDDFVPALPSGEECFFHLFKDGDLTNCLGGKWLVMTGGSNMFAQFLFTANFYADDIILNAQPDVWCCPFPTIQATGGRQGADVIDLVFDANRKVIHKKIARFKAQATGTNPGGMSSYTDVFDQAPYVPGAFRLTITAGMYWEQVAMPWKAVHTRQGAWANSKRFYWTQCSQWYRICSWGPCPRQDLMNLGESGVQAKYKTAIDDAFDTALTEVCSDANTMGCYFSSNMYGGQAQAVALMAYTSFIETAVNDRKATNQKLHFFDVYALTSMKTAEVKGGHSSPMMYLWLVQVIFNNVCSDPPGNKFADQCPARVILDHNCHWADNAKKCGGNDFNCRLGFACSFKFEAVEPSSNSDAESPSAEKTCSPVDLSKVLDVKSATRPVLEAPEVPTNSAVSTGAEDNSNLCRRRLGKHWCSNGLSALPIAFGALASLAFFGAHVFKWMRSRRGMGKVRDIAGANDHSDLQQAANEGSSDKLAKDGLPDANGSNQPTNDDSAPLVVGRAFDADYTAIPVAGQTETPTSQEKHPKLAAVGPAEENSMDVLMAKTAPKEWLHAIGASRFLASIHIVMGHMVRKKPSVIQWPGGSNSFTDNLDYMFDWGFTWVPWFFMLSGYVLTHARLANPRSKPILQFVQERLSNIYPLYAFGVVLALILRWSRDGARLPVTGGILQAWLLQAWIPPYAEQSIQPHCWFLSCMPLQWMCFQFMFRHLSKLGRLSLCCICVAAMLLPWIVVVIIPLAISKPLNWYEGRTWDSKSNGYSFSSTRDVLVLLLKFHPLCYLHLFIIGMLLALIRRRMLEAGSVVWRRLMYLAAEVGYAGLLVIFFLGDSSNYRLATRLSVLAPLQALVLLGLSESGGPLCQLFSLGLVAVLGEISYAQYILQFICWTLWPTPSGAIDPGWLVFLFGSSVVLYFGVQKPCQALWRSAKWPCSLALLVPPALLSVLLATASLTMRDPAASECAAAKPLPALPEALRTYSVGAVIFDRSLEFQTRAPLEGYACDSPLFINPSITVTRGGDLVLAVRRHATGQKRGQGEYRNRSVAELRQMWYSDILVAQLKWRGSFNATLAGGSIRLAPLNLRTAHRTGGRPWTDLCPSKGVYVAANDTLIRKYVTGPEDPRIIGFRGGAVLAFNSMPPDEDGACPEIPVTKMYLAQGVLARCAAIPGLSRPGSTAPALPVPVVRDAPTVPGSEASCICGAGRVRTLETYVDTERGVTRSCGGAETACKGGACKCDALRLFFRTTACCEEIDDCVDDVEQLNVDCKASPTCDPRALNTCRHVVEQALCKFPLPDIANWAKKVCPKSCGACGKQEVEKATMHDPKKCSDNGNDCCAHAMWNEPQTCSSGYLPLNGKHVDRPCQYSPSCPMPNACYGCFPPDFCKATKEVWSKQKVAVELDCSERKDKPEKNWIGFEHGSQLFWVYSVQPHVVVAARSTDGKCSEVSRTSYDPLALLLKQKPEIQVHGSGTAVPWANCPGDATSCFLAAYHTLDQSRSSGRVYVHFFYKFAATHPFQILESARRPLPLLEAQPADGKEAFAFLSGLAVAPGGEELLLSYSAGDRQSRILVMEAAHVETYFTCLDVPTKG